MFKKKKENEQKAEDNFMLYVPHIKHPHWEEQNGLVYIITYHNHPVQKMANWLVKKSNKSDVKLDELGSTVWKAMDGNRNVFQIGEIIKEKFGEDCEPVYDRLIMFMRYLNRRGWIYFENVMSKKTIER